MPQRVQVPGVGVVEFPDGISGAQMAEAIRRFGPAQPAPVRPVPSHVTRTVTPMPAHKTADVVQPAPSVNQPQEWGFPGTPAFNSPTSIFGQAADLTQPLFNLLGLGRSPEHATVDTDGKNGLPRFLTTNTAPMFEPAIAGMTAFHGSPHIFDEFRLDKIGTGEGAQAYGHGLYFAENPRVAKSYRSQLSGELMYDGKPITRDIDQRAAELLMDSGGDKAAALKAASTFYKPNPSTRPELTEWANAHLLNAVEAMDFAKLTRSTGALYQVHIPDEHIENMLDWDKPLSEQSPTVRDALTKAGYKIGGQFPPSKRGARRNWAIPPMTLYEGDPGSLIYYKMQMDREGGQKAASEFLNSIGIPGIKYWDGGSRSSGEGTRNFVIFDPDKSVKIIERK